MIGLSRKKCVIQISVVGNDAVRNKIMRPLDFDVVDMVVAHEADGDNPLPRNVTILITSKV